MLFGTFYKVRMLFKISTDDETISHKDIKLNTKFFPKRLMEPIWKSKNVDLVE